MLAKICCQAAPPPPPPQAEPVPDTTPLVSTFRHWVEPVMEFSVRPPVTVTAPLNLVLPKTERVVEGEAVPIPTMPPVNTATGYASLEVPGWVTVKAEAEEEAEI